MKTCFLIALVAVMLASINAQTCTEVDNCDSCSNPGPLCEDCPDYYVLSQDRTKCLSCGDGCEECTSDAADVVTCVECMDFFYVASGSCSLCGDGCTMCHEDTGSIVCDECMDMGYTQDMSTTSQSCVACDSNCKSCSMNEDGSTTCSECYSFSGMSSRGYYLKLEDKSCKSCPSGCEKCSDDGTGSGICNDCYTGYEILIDENDSTNDGTKCVRCPATCSTCSGVEYDTGVATCTDCMPNVGLFLSSGECLECDANCDTCDTDGSCVLCDDYYRVDGGSCTECPPFCIECTLDETTGEETCDMCKTKYGSKITTSITCDACGISNCAVCARDATDGSMSCSSCKTNYGFDENGKCSSCPTGCSACQYSTDHTKCTACKAGFTDTVYPASGSSSAGTPSVCEECSSDCNSCDFDGTGNNDCADCADGYFIDTSGSPDVCTINPDNCLTVDGSNGDCTACMDGYTVDTGACVACTASDCETCSNTLLTECSSCPTYYTIVDSDFDNSTDSCEACGISKCQRCISWGRYGGARKTCFMCDTGYIQYDSSAGSRKAVLGGSCKKCPTGCDTCTVDYASTGDPTECSSNGCAAWNGKKAYTNDDAGGCAQCPSQCRVCTYDASSESTSCTSNQCEGVYALNDDSGECDACPDNCGGCEYDATLSSVVCSDGMCMTGYGKISDGSCSECPNRCDVCTTSDASDADPDLLFCDSCSDSYAINSDVCAGCPSSCEVCSDSSGTMICSMCVDGYALDSSKNCMKCPTNCESCTAGSTVMCTDCKDGYALAGDKLSCTDCATAAFDNCAECGDINATTGIAECDECMTGFTLEDEMETLSCKSTSGLSCMGGDEVDNPPECSACSTGFFINDDFVCAINCYTCGDIETDMFVPQGECMIPAAGANTTEGFAELEDCTEGACYAAYKDGMVMAGCMPENVNGGMCGTDYMSEVCKDTAMDNRCEQCCTDDSCNTFVATLDGIPDDSGATFVAINALLLSVCALLAGRF